MVTKSERKFYLKHFKSISHAIATYEDLETLMKHLVEGTARSFKARGCSIMLLDERVHELFHVASHGISEEYLHKGPILFVDDKQCAIYTGEPVHVEDMQNDPIVQYPKAAAREGIVSMLSIPIKCRKAVTGILRIYFGESRILHEEDVESLTIMNELLGLVIENNGLKNFLDQVKMGLDSLPLRLLEGD